MHSDAFYMLPCGATLDDDRRCPSSRPNSVNHCCVDDMQTCPNVSSNDLRNNTQDPSVSVPAGESMSCFIRSWAA